MTVRDLIVALVLISLLPSCYKRPFVGLLVFSWLAYMRVQDLAWGFARHMRWSYYVAILTFVGFVGKAKGKYFLPDVRCYVMIILVILAGIGLALSQEPTLRHFERYLEFVKIIAIALFTTAVVNDRERLRVILWVIALSLGFYGIKSGLGAVASGGNMHIKRGPGGMLADNNDFSLALSMSVPMLFHLGWTERQELVRRVFWFAMPLTVLTVLMTQSRGGFLAVAMASAVLVWRSKNRLHGIAFGLLAGLAALLFSPQEYRDRLMTMTQPSEEGSAASRLRAWGIATRMATDNPLLGVGFGMFPKRFLEYCEDPNPQELAGRGIIVAHSSYFQIWAEFGTISLLLYLSLIVTSFFTIWKIRKMATSRYYASWMLKHCTLFEASLVAFTVGSAFLNRAHFDLFYHWVALIVCFAVIAREEMTGKEAGAVRQGRRGPVSAVRQPGFAPRLQPTGGLSGQVRRA